MGRRGYHAEPGLSSHRDPSDALATTGSHGFTSAVPRLVSPTGVGALDGPVPWTAWASTVRISRSASQADRGQLAGDRDLGEQLVADDHLVVPEALAVAGPPLAADQRHHRDAPARVVRAGEVDPADDRVQLGLADRVGQRLPV